VELTVSELAALVGGQLASGADGSATISRAASLAEATSGDVTFFGTPKYLAQLRVTKATAALVPADFAEAVPPACIRCADPSAAFSIIVGKLAPPPVRFLPGVHPTAVVGRDVKFAKDVSIQPFAVIEDGAEIGERSVVGAHGYVGHGARIGTDCVLHPRVTIAARCTLGNRVTIHSGSVIGADGFGYDFQQGRYVKIPQTGIVQVDDDVEIGANTCVDRARFGRTWIGAGTKLDNLVQVGHNVIMGKHCIVCGHTGIAGSAVIGNYVTIAGLVGVAGHIEIGDQAIVAGHSGVTKSVPAKQTVMGMPATPAIEFKEQNFHVRTLGKLKARVRDLEKRLGEPEEEPPAG
jgi:UDP-3-O-[3-hydroxymyristoyl] glucosamine N-acyltransferase